MLPCITFTFSLTEEETRKIPKIIPELSDEKTITLKREGNDVKSYSIIVPRDKLLPKLNRMKNKLVAERNELEKQLEKANQGFSITTIKAVLTRNEKPRSIPKKPHILNKIPRSLRTNTAV